MTRQILRIFPLFALLISQSGLFAENPIHYHRKITWEGIRSEQFSENEKIRFLSFKGANFGTNHLPLYFERIKLAKGTGELNVEITDAVFTELTPEEAALISLKD